MRRLRTLLEQVAGHEGLNFVLTNRIPRLASSRFMGWFSRIEQPLVYRLSMAAWRWCGGDLRLDEALETRFSSLHDCFTRELKPGARRIDATPNVVVSPCDGIVVGAGAIADGTLIQAKGLTYGLGELLGDGAAAARFEGGVYVTLRLTSVMYHRFHAPCDAVVRRVRLIGGDLWNVNPPALRRVPRLYCQNERAVIELDTTACGPFALVAVGAILVGSIHLGFVPLTFQQTYRGAADFGCFAPVTKGGELGYFHHGSTVIVVAPRGAEKPGHIAPGRHVRMGEALLLSAHARSATRGEGPPGQ